MGNTHDATLHCLSSSVRNDPSLRAGVQYMVAATSLVRRFVGIPHYHQVYETSYRVSYLGGLLLLLLQSSAVEQVLDIPLLYLHIVLSAAACLNVT